MIVTFYFVFYWSWSKNNHLLILPHYLKTTILYSTSKSGLKRSIPVYSLLLYKKKNPSYLPPKEFREITQQDVLYFLAYYYYITWATVDYQLEAITRNDNYKTAVYHWIGWTVYIILCDKFDYIYDVIFLYRKERMMLKLLMTRYFWWNW